MFILRRILKDGVEINSCLGDFYVLVRKEENEAEFQRTIKLWSEDDLEGVLAVITYNDGEDIIPIHKGSSYFVMTGNGATFDCFKWAN